MTRAHNFTRKQTAIVSEQMIRAFCEEFCCEGGCAYREEGRKPECDAVCGNDAWDAMIKRALEAALGVQP